MSSLPFFIVGLGNPGPAYTYTRHNLGFLVIDAYLSSYHNNEFALNNLSPQKKHHSEIWELSQMQPKIYLVKPQTFMNKSGEAILSIMSAYKLHPSQLLIIYDDISLPFGKIKVKQTGSSGGHNGIESIIKKIGKTFMRLKCGIGPTPISNEQKTASTPPIPLHQYVLNSFNHEEKQKLTSYCLTLAQIAQTLVQSNPDKLLTHLNGKLFEAIPLKILHRIAPNNP